MRIRQYSPADADQVWTVHEKAMRASSLEFYGNAPGDEPLRNVSEGYLDEGGAFLLGIVDDEAVAVGGFLPGDEETVEIRHMRVHPSHQRQGYGERLLRELESRARERDFSRVVLHTSERLTAAREMYRKHGYEETHRKTIEVTDDEFIYYEKAL